MLYKVCSVDWNQHTAGVSHETTVRSADETNFVFVLVKNAFHKVRTKKVFFLREDLGNTFTLMIYVGDWGHNAFDPMADIGLEQRGLD